MVVVIDSMKDNDRPNGFCWEKEIVNFFELKVLINFGVIMNI